MSLPSEQELRKKLWSWVSGHTCDGDMTDWAWEHTGDTVPEDDPDYPIRVVIDHLCALFEEGLTSGDGLILLQYLDMANRGNTEATKMLDRHLSMQPRSPDHVEIDADDIPLLMD